MQLGQSAFSAWAAAWAKRVFYSLNGVTTTISVKNGIILDTEPISKYCLARAPGVH